MPAFSPASYRPLFPISAHCIYVNHAGVSPGNTRAADAMARWTQEWVSGGIRAADAWREQEARGRELAAALLNCAPHEIAYVRSTSHGLGLAAESIDWRPGDEVLVCTEAEYPSNVYPWLHLASRGVRVVDVPAREGGVSVEEVAARVTSHTRLIAASSVQYATGATTDLGALGQLAASRDLLFCVDGIQSLGAFPLEVGAGVHFVAADAHKWLLGPLGIGVFYVSDAVVERCRPPLVGWKSTTDAWNFDRLHFELKPDASRFEEGSLSWGLIAGLVASLEILVEVGVSTVRAHVRELLEHLEQGLLSLGAEVGPRPGLRAGSLIVRFREHDAQALCDALGARGVVCSARRGALRFSPHLYNTFDEMDTIVSTLRGLIKP